MTTRTTIEEDSSFAKVVDQPVPTEKLRAPRDSTKRPVVIFFNGTFNPVHAGHLDALVSAKRALEEDGGYEVLGAYFSPCSTHYAEGKLGAERLETRHRINMCQLVADGTDFVMVDTNECYHRTSHLDPIAMLEALEKRLRTASPLAGLPVSVVWLHGPDSGYYVPRRTTVVVVNRRGDEAEVERMREISAKLKSQPDPATRLIVVQSKDLGLSSTEIRSSPQALERCYAEFPMILAYIRKYRLLLKGEACPTQCPADLLADIARRLVFTGEQLNALLQHADGLLVPGCTVKNFEVARIGSRYGLRSRVFRVSVTDGSTTVPTFVLKIGSQHVECGEYHEREFSFYRKLGNTLGCLRVPRCYLASLVDGICFTVLEDISSGISCEGRIPLERVLIAARAFGQFHAEFWDHPLHGDRESRIGWLQPMAGKKWKDELVLHFQMYWRYLGKRLTVLFSAAWLDFCSNYQKTIPQLIDEICELCPAMVVHGDLWRHNMCFMPIASKPSDFEMLLYDWQTACWGCGIFDLAALIDTSGTCQHTSKILSLYYDTLLRCGVSNQRFTWAKFIHVFRLCKRLSFVYHIPVLGQDALGFDATPEDLPIINDLRDR